MNIDRVINKILLTKKIMIHTLRPHYYAGAVALLLQALFASRSFAQVPTPNHVVILIEENYSYSQIIGSSYAPHINAICADTNAAVFSQAYAIEHPSEPDYLDFFSGSNQGVFDDGVPSGYPFTTDNLGAELIAASKTFVTYAEDLPSVGYDGATYTAGGANYARKHNPCTNWVGAGTNQFPATVNQPYTAFPIFANYSTLPTVCYVIPNMTNDMHDGSYPGNITIGDTWMFNHLDSLRQWALTNNTLYVIIFDEDDDLHGNNIPCIFYGPMVKGGTYTEHTDLFSILRTIEDMYGLPHAGSAASGTTITDCWKIHTTGINNTASGHSFKVIPNPASDVINFNCITTLNTPATIIVSDATGHIAGKYTITGSSLEVNSSVFAQGVYSYNIISENGNKLDEGKFVITHN